MGEDERRKPRNPGEAIYYAALDARQFSENLQPLLKLLETEETGDGPGPLDEMTGLLSAMITILSRHGESLSRIERALSIAQLPSV